MSRDLAKTRPGKISCWMVAGAGFEPCFVDRPDLPPVSANLDTTATFGL